MSFPKINCPEIHVTENQDSCESEFLQKFTIFNFSTVYKKIIKRRYIVATGPQTANDSGGRSLYMTT